MAIEFFYRVLDKDYNSGIYSDEARLWREEGWDKERGKLIKRQIINRAKMAYSIDITDVYDEPLYKIFENIKDNQGG
jgi:hypothetical protein